jgi:hypothetical protein
LPSTPFAPVPLPLPLFSSFLFFSFLFFLISSHQSQIYTITHMNHRFNHTYESLIQSFNHSQIHYKNHESKIHNNTNQNSQEHVHRKPPGEPNLRLTHGRRTGEGRAAPPVRPPPANARQAGALGRMRSPAPSHARRRGGRRSRSCVPRQPGCPASRRALACSLRPAPTRRPVWERIKGVQEKK